MAPARLNSFPLHRKCVQSFSIASHFVFNRFSIKSQSSPIAILIQVLSMKRSAETPNAKLKNDGVIDLTDEAGNPIEHNPRFSLCGCGKSDNMPFCDGAHKEE